MTPNREYFEEIDRIRYEGPDSDTLLAFRFYDPGRVVAGKALRDHFRFASAYWHSFGNTGMDPFGSGTRNFAWARAADPLDRARAKMDAAFEMMGKLGLEYFCFHDYDLVDEADSLSQSERRLQEITDYALEKMAATGIKVLWGTANLFSNPRYMSGAATNPDFEVVAHAAAQVNTPLMPPSNWVERITCSGEDEKATCPS